MREQPPSTPGPVIEVWEGHAQTCGHAGMPTPVFHVHGRVWSDAGVHSLSWSLNGRGRIPVSIGPTAFRVARGGDFAIVLERAWLRAGENELLILANDAAGRESTARVRLDLRSSVRASLPMVVEWEGADRVGERAEVIDGRWRIEDGAARTVETGYDRALAIGDVDWTGFEVRVGMTMHGMDASPAVMQWPSLGAAAGVVLKWRRHAEWGDILPARGWFPLGAMVRLEHGPGDPVRTARLRLRAGGFVPPLAEGPRMELEPGARLMLRARVRGRGGGRAGVYDAKVWRADGPEPAAWTLSAEGVPGELASGSLVLSAHHWDVSFGRVQIAPVEP